MMKLLPVSPETRGRASRKILQTTVATNCKACWTVLAVICLIGLTNCGSSNSNNSKTPPPQEVVSIAATSGASQSATVSTAFAPFLATVTTNGAATSGVAVTFTAPATGASGTFANGKTTETDTTNASGVATSSVFTANGSTGSYAVMASVAGASTPASFSLKNTAAAAPVVTIAATGGTSQSATVSTAFSAHLEAMVSTNGKPTSGAAVTFTAPATGASGIFANGKTSETDTTGPNGVAISSAFTANGSTGSYAVMASVTGASTPASFSLKNTAAPPPPTLAIAATGGASQNATFSTSFAAPLQATVTTNGTPTSGVAVTFMAPTTGASGTFANGTATETDTTDANGVATSTAFTANRSVGPYTVTASVAGASTPASFNLANAAKLYSFYLSGLERSNGLAKLYALAGSVKLDGNGNVLGGEEDYNDAHGITSPQPGGDTITAGRLAVDANTGQGTLTLITGNTNLGVSGTETLGVQFVNPNHALIVQFDGTATSSGTMDLQTLPSTLSGGYAFTFSGMDSSANPVVYGGVFAINGTSLENGITDTNDAGVVTIATASAGTIGTISAPDSFGRGTLTSAALPMTLNCYVVGPEVIRIIDVDTGDTGIGSAFGQGTGAFSNASLTGSYVFGFEGNPWSVAAFSTLNATAGMFTTTPASGTFQGVADNNEDGNIINIASAISGSYSVSPAISGTVYNGYGSLTITPGNLGNISAVGVYLTDPNLNLTDPNNTSSGLGGALVVDLDTVFGGTGVLVPQTDTNPADFAGNYAFGAQEYNGESVWEFDFVGQGSVSSAVLSGTGLVSDPGSFFTGGSPADTGVTFSGTANPDPSNVGRFQLPLAITVGAGSPVNLDIVIYQASSGQLFWMDDDMNSVFLGSLVKQGTLSGMPLARKPVAKAKLKQK